MGIKTHTPGLLKYVLGLAVLLAFTLGIAGWVLVQAGDVKTDAKTHESAEEIGRDLQSYISRKNTIPTKLSDATSKDIPNEVTYTKLTSSKYEFCVTYKTGSANVNAYEIQSKLVPTYGVDVDSSPLSINEPSYLYLSSNHKKGENCQTIKPYISLGSTLRGSDIVNGTGLPRAKSYVESSDCKMPSDTSDTAGYDDYFECLSTQQVMPSMLQ